MRASPLCLCVLLAVVASCAVAADLPLRQVVLFSSGVGYFQREGVVEGDATVQLAFRTEQINDLLKSLVLMDRDGGKVAPVTYAPEEPLARTLASFEVDISDNPSLTQLLDKLRGSPVEVVADTTLTGTVVGMEQQQKSVEEGTVTFDVLNLLTDAGLQQVPIWHIKSVKLTDAKVSGDLRKALAALNASRDTDTRPVTLSFTGTGERHVMAGYLLETPVWKTSYRLVQEKEGLFLQGWAIVENTTDDDWANVQLALIAGRPISFIQDLYQPLYVQRPVVPPSVQGAPAPQVYGRAVESKEEAPAEADAYMARRADALDERVTAGVAMAAGGRGGGGFGLGYSNLGELVTGAGVAAMAQAQQVGELFQYAVEQPVTIPRQQSAMIPIVNGTIEGEKVSVYNAGVHTEFPLNGLKLKNSTGLHLMGGPVTVFDGGVYAGDALVTDIPAGDERLLTYALDQAIEVEAKAEGRPQEIVSLKVSRGVLIVTTKQRMEMTYTANSVAKEPRTLIIEHPIKPDWNLIEPAQPEERTQQVYRFRVNLEPGATQKLTVIEEQPGTTQVALTEADLDAIGIYLRAPAISEALRAALQQIVDMKTGIADLSRQRAEKEARLKEIGEEQDRIRKNMEQLDRESELYKRYVDKFAAQETEYEQLQGDSKALQQQEDDQQKALEQFILNLSVE